MAKKKSNQKISVKGHTKITPSGKRVRVQPHTRSPPKRRKKKRR